MPGSRHTGLVVSAILVLAVAGTLGTLWWIRSERIWLQANPPEVTLSFRVNGAAIASPEFRDVLDAVNTVVFQSGILLPRRMAMGTPTIATHAYHAAYGPVRAGTTLEAELPRIREDIRKILAAKGVRATWRLAVIAPDGRITMAD